MHTGETWRLGRRPALDGLRGIAVLLVVASHLTESALRPLGMAGVVMFFALSGFLITALLLEEREGGAIAFRAFYVRRARRLLPAALTCIAVTFALGLTTPRLAVAAATYSANWVSVNGIGPHDGLAHTWSLSIEEQFYLLWPVALVVVARFGRRAMLAVTMAGVVASLVERIVFGPEHWARVYLGTDTRADGLLLGALLAIWLKGREVRVPLAPLAGVGVVATIVAGLWHEPRFEIAWLPFVAAAGTLLALWVASQGSVRWLEARWLRSVGRVSYGLYLWHWPVIVALHRIWPAPGARILLALPISAALTYASWRWVEQPFLRKRVDLHDRLRSAGAGVHATSRGRAREHDVPRPLVGVGRAGS